MSLPDVLQEVLAEGCVARPVGDGVYSVFADGARENHQYDRLAGVYDLVVGTSLYNRVMWGNGTGDYEEFARRAIGSPASGRVLDAACGSLLFTARAYRETTRQIVAFDQSLRMLGRARARLAELAGEVPPNVVFLQADIGALPFRPGVFQTVLCMNVLHHVADAGSLLPRLRSLVGGGQLHLTTLVKTGRFVGDRYLEILHRTGELARPRRSAELRELLDDAAGRGVSYRTKGNMAYVVTDCLAVTDGPAANASLP